MGIYVWGTGCGASELLEKGLAAERITAFVDSFSAGTYVGKPVILPRNLDAQDCSLLIVTTRQTEDVARQCRASTAASAAPGMSAAAWRQAAVCCWS